MLVNLYQKDLLKQIRKHSMATPGYAALYRVPGAQQSGSRDKPVDNVVGEDKAPTMGLYSPGTPMEVQSPGQPQRLFDPSRARYAAGGLTGVFEEKEVSDDPGYRAYEEGGIVIPELQAAQDAGMPIDMINRDEDFDNDAAEEMPDIDVVSDEIEQAMKVDVDTSMLSMDDETILEQALEDYPQLMDIIPKMLMAAQPNMVGGVEEFTGEGEVEGPGTGTSDSVPAMLSDGEFVITAKAVKQIGVDKLRKMMKKAEDDYDKDMNIQEEQQMEDAPSDVMSAAYGGLLNNPYK
jgi:hypothetical protein